MIAQLEKTKNISISHRNSLTTTHVLMHHPKCDRKAVLYHRVNSKRNTASDNERRFDFDGMEISGIVGKICCCCESQKVIIFMSAAASVLFGYSSIRHRVKKTNYPAFTIKIFGLKFQTLSKSCRILTDLAGSWRILREYDRS